MKRGLLAALRAAALALATLIVAAPAISPASAQLATQTLQRPDYASLAAVNPANLTANAVAVVADAHLGGTFRWRTGDQSARVTADPRRCIWVAPSAASSGSSGAWQRQIGTRFEAAWCGIAPRTDDLTAATYSGAVLDQIVAAAKDASVFNVYFPRGVFGITSKPSAMTAGIRLHGQGLSRTKLRRDYSEAGGESACFLEWTGGGGDSDLSRLNGGFFNLILYANDGTTGGSMACFTTVTNEINSWFEAEDAAITRAGTGEYLVGLRVDGTSNTLSGSQGLRDFRSRGLFVFQPNSGASYYAAKFLNATNGSHEAFWATGRVLVGGGGTALSNTLDFTMSDVKLLGPLVIENADQFRIEGLFTDLDIKATATRGVVEGTKRSGSTSIANASLSVSTQLQDSLNLMSTDSGSGIDPILNCDRNSASPLAGDSLCILRFRGMDSGGAVENYAWIYGGIASPTAGAEYGVLKLGSIQNGSGADKFLVGSGLYAASLTDPGLGKANFTEVQVNGVAIGGAKGAFAVHRNGTDLTGLTADAANKITWTTELLDESGWFASDKYTPLVAGYYKFCAAASANTDAGGETPSLYIYKNGASIAQALYSSSGFAAGIPFAQQVCTVAQANGSTDYFEAYEYLPTGITTISGAIARTHFEGWRISP